MSKLLFYDDGYCSIDENDACNASQPYNQPMKVIAFTIPVRQDRTVILKHEEGEQFYPHLHRHEEMQLTWVQRGKGTLLVGEQLHDFGPGDILLFSANLPHLFKNDPQMKGMQALSLFFSKDNLLWKLPELQRIAHRLEHMQGAFQVKASIAGEIRKYINDIEERPAAWRLPIFIELMQRLLSGDELDFIGQSTGPQVSDREGLRINIVLQYVINNYHRTITLEEVAKQIHMVPGSFCRFFKKRTGKTFIYFLNEMRIREACRRLIAQRDRQVAEVAYDCGFRNVSSFNRVFRQVTGQSPTDYRISLAEL